MGCAKNEIFFSWNVATFQRCFVDLFWSVGSYFEYRDD